MRVAVLADIHGNLLALNAVLTDLAAAGGADRFWVLGDLASFGPQPEGTLARLTSLPQAHIISGNTDRYLVTNARPSGPLPRNAADWDRLPAVLLEREENFRWTVAQLGYEWFTFLRDLRHSCVSMYRPMAASWPSTVRRAATRRTSSRRQQTPRSRRCWQGPWRSWSSVGTRTSRSTARLVGAGLSIRAVLVCRVEMETTALRMRCSHLLKDNARPPSAA